MTEPQVDLAATWRSLAGAGHDHLLHVLVTCHGEPHRRYHTTTHVLWVLHHVNALLAAHRAATGGQPGGAVDEAALQLAALYHDVIYDPTAADNEARSAAMALAAAWELGWSAQRCQLVQRLVLATAGHQALDEYEAILIDADLAILGASPDQYARYVADVRAEYAHVSAADWRTGRGGVLRKLLARTHIYFTRAMSEARETTARANLTAELSTLEQP